MRKLKPIPQQRALTPEQMDLLHQARDIYHTMIDQWKTPYFIRDPQKLVVFLKGGKNFFDGKEISRLIVNEYLHPRYGMPCGIVLEQTDRGVTKNCFVLPEVVNVTAIDRTCQPPAVYDRADLSRD